MSQLEARSRQLFYQLNLFLLILFLILFLSAVKIAIQVYFQGAVRDYLSSSDFVCFCFNQADFYYFQSLIIATLFLLYSLFLYDAS